MHITTSRADAIERAKKYNDKGIAVSFSYLPLEACCEEDVQDDVAEYLALFDAITTQGLDADVTIKPTQFGGLRGIEYLREGLQPVLEDSQRTRVRIWFDQEFEILVPDVIAVATEQPVETTGICLQAYRSRTENDVRAVRGFPVRLVKGFYDDYDIRPWSKVTENYKKLMERVAEQSPYPCFATHDIELVEIAKALLQNREGEIQFFSGVRDTLAEQLVAEGYRVRIYVPYGRVIQFLWQGWSTFDMPRALQRLAGVSVIR